MRYNQSTQKISKNKTANKATSKKSSGSGSLPSSIKPAGLAQKRRPPQKAVETRNTARQKGATAGRRRHKKNYTLNYILVFLLLAITGVTLSMTVFFKVSVVEVIGEHIYSNSEIVEVSGLKTGENLIAINTSQAEKKLKNNYVDLENVLVSRKFPDKVQIELIPAKVKAVLKYEDKYYSLSQGNRIIEVSDSMPMVEVEAAALIESNASNDSGTPMRMADAATVQPAISFVGVDLFEIEAGAYLTDTGKYKLEAIDTIVGATAENNMGEIQVADITDVMLMSLYYEDNYEIKVGGTQELSYKLHCAKSIIDEKLSLDGQNGVIDVSVDNGTYYFRPSDQISAP